MERNVDFRRTRRRKRIQQLRSYSAHVPFPFGALMSWLGAVATQLPRIVAIMDAEMRKPRTVEELYDRWMSDPRPWTFGEYLICYRTGASPDAEENAKPHRKLWNVRQR